MTTQPGPLVMYGGPEIRTSDLLISSQDDGNLAKSNTAQTNQTVIHKLSSHGRYCPRAAQLQMLHLQPLSEGQPQAFCCSSVNVYTNDLPKLRDQKLKLCQRPFPRCCALGRAESVRIVLVEDPVKVYPSRSVCRFELCLLNGRVIQPDSSGRLLWLA